MIKRVVSMTRNDLGFKPPISLERGKSKHRKDDCEGVRDTERYMKRTAGTISGPSNR